MRERLKNMKVLIFIDDLDDQAIGIDKPKTTELRAMPGKNRGCHFESLVVNISK